MRIIFRKRKGPCWWLAGPAAIYLRKTNQSISCEAAGMGGAVRPALPDAMQDYRWLSPAFAVKASTRTVGSRSIEKMPLSCAVRVVRIRQLLGLPRFKRRLETLSGLPRRQQALAGGGASTWLLIVIMLEGSSNPWVLAYSESMSYPASSLKQTKASRKHSARIWRVGWASKLKYIFGPYVWP